MIFKNLSPKKNVNVGSVEFYADFERFPEMQKNCSQKINLQKQCRKIEFSSFHYCSSKVFWDAFFGVHYYEIISIDLTSADNCLTYF
jgi:hypothetical protein